MVSFQLPEMAQLGCNPQIWASWTGFKLTGPFSDADLPDCVCRGVSKTTRFALLFSGTEEYFDPDPDEHHGTRTPLLLAPDV